MSLSLAAAFTIVATAGFPVPPPGTYQRTTAVDVACPPKSYACVIWSDPPMLAMPKNTASAAAIHEVAHLVDAIFIKQRQRSYLKKLLHKGQSPITPQEPGLLSTTWIRFYAERYADSVARCLDYPASYTHRPRLPKTTRRFCRALIPD